VLLHTTLSSADECTRALSEDASKSSKGLSVIAVVDDAETKGVRMEIIMDSWKSYGAFEQSDAASVVIRGTDSAVKIRPIAGFLGREDKSKL
jgi:hypothetical protein